VNEIETLIETKVQERLELTKRRLMTEVERLQEINAKNAESRRFKRGPFDLTQDSKRRDLIDTLCVVVDAL
jgi:hypothetical protein